MEQTKKTIDYFELLREAFDFTIKHKILWFFGFVAVLFPGSGSGSIPKMMEKFSPTPQRDLSTGTTWYPSSEMSSPYSQNPAINSMRNFIESPAFLSVAVLVVLFIIIVMILSWYLTNVCKVSLVKSVIYDAAGKSSKINIKELWRESHEFLLRILGYNLIMIGLSSPLFFVMIVVSIFTGVFGMICSCCVWIPLMLVWAVVFGAMSMFGSRLIVVEDMGAVEALSASWTMFKENFRKYILALLVLMLPGIVVGVVFAIVGAASSLLLLPCIRLMQLLIDQSMTVVAVFVGLLWTFGISVVIAALQSPWFVFAESYWTKFFLKISSDRSFKN